MGRPKGKLDSSPTAMENRRKAHLGLKYSEEHRKAISEGLKKYKRTLEHSKNQSISLIKNGSVSGNKNPNWKGGLQKIRRPRNTAQYYSWRKSVFERDDYTCQLCSRRGGCLEADHINRWKYYPELRFEVSNGRTLCKPCHKKVTWGN